MGNNKDNFYKENNGASNPEEEDMTVARDEEARAEEVQEGAEVEQAETEDELTILEKKVVDLEAQVEKEKKEYLFLMADFDNFRKRTLREKSELIRNGGESVLKGILPIMDDFERAIKASETSDDSEAMKEGMNLIYQKLQKFLQQNGVKEMDPADDTFVLRQEQRKGNRSYPRQSQTEKSRQRIQRGR